MLGGRICTAIDHSAPIHQLQEVVGGLTSAKGMIEKGHGYTFLNVLKAHVPQLRWFLYACLFLLPPLRIQTHQGLPLPGYEEMKYTKSTLAL